MTYRETAYALLAWWRAMRRADIVVTVTYTRRNSADRRVYVHEHFARWIGRAEEVDWLRFFGRHLLRIADGKAAQPPPGLAVGMGGAPAVEQLGPGVWLKQLPDGYHRPWPEGVEGPTRSNTRFVSWDEWCDALDAQPSSLPRLATDLILDDEGRYLVARWDYLARRWMLLSREDAEMPYSERLRLPKESAHAEDGRP
jgi:hypothetical protein